MIIPLQITFRGMEASEAIAAKIRQKSAKLDRFSDRITTVRVVFEQLHQHQHQGNLFHVRIDLTLAGGELVIGAEHHDKQAHEDPYVAIRDAFDAARRRLEDFAREHDHRKKIHPEAMRGRVSSLSPERGFGRIEASDGRDVYFHCNSVVTGRFEELKPGSEVRFDLHEGEGHNGPQASTVHTIRTMGHGPHA